MYSLRPRNVASGLSFSFEAFRAFHLQMSGLRLRTNKTFILNINLGGCCQGFRTMGGVGYMRKGKT